MGIKIGNIDASYFKVGSGDCSIYLGDTLLYPTAQPSYKFQATYSDSSTYNEECDSSTTLSYGTVKPSGYTFESMTTAIVGDCIDGFATRLFRGATGLTSIEIPSGVTSLPLECFYLCYSLRDITIPSGVTSLGRKCFANCYALEDIVIPDMVTSVGQETFQACTSLTSVTLSKNCTFVPSSMFYGCSSLSSVTIPSGVTYIGQFSFQNCKSLSSVTIPSTVVNIDSSAFYNCSSLTYVIVEATTPPTLGTNVFNNTNNCPIYVPAESVNTYKAATNWSSYASRIQAIPTLQWVSYYEGDSVPNYGVYGIKFQSSASYEYVETPAYIGFIDGNNNYINIYYDNGTWYIETASGAEEITFDEETDYATIIFDDYGVGAATIDEMALLSTGMPFDMELYELN